MGHAGGPGAVTGTTPQRALPGSPRAHTSWGSEEARAQWSCRKRTGEQHSEGDLACGRPEGRSRAREDAREQITNAGVPGAEGDKSDFAFLPFTPTEKPIFVLICLSLMPSTAPCTSRLEGTGKLQAITMSPCLEHSILTQCCCLAVRSAGV